MRKSSRHEAGIALLTCKIKRPEMFFGAFASRTAQNYCTVAVKLVGGFGRVLPVKNS